MAEQDLPRGRAGLAASGLPCAAQHRVGRAGERRADDRAGPLRHHSANLQDSLGLPSPNGAGAPDPPDLACNALHSIAEAAPEWAVQMTERDLFVAAQQAIANRAGEPDLQDQACIALHNIALTAPENAVHMAKQDLLGALPQPMASCAGVPDPQDQAYIALRSIAEAAPESAVQMTVLNLIGTIQQSRRTGQAGSFGRTANRGRGGTLNRR